MPTPTIQRAPTPTNPCYEDMKKLRCTDTACLRRSAELLSPSCAAFLLDQQGYPEPSPSPAPFFSVSRMPVPVLARRPAPKPSSGGYFSMYSNINGKVQHAEGPLGGHVLQPMSGFASLLPFAEMMMPAFEVEMSQMGREMDRVFDQLEAEAEAEAAAPQHPCWREVPACIQETGTEERDAIYGCLLRHRPQLSHECGCFVDHTVRPAASAPAKGIAAVPVRGAPGAAFMLVSVLVLRACLRACFAPRKLPREVVMTPP